MPTITMLRKADLLRALELDAIDLVGDEAAAGNGDAPLVELGEPGVGQIVHAAGTGLQARVAALIE
jgi:hypothetical protein